MPAKILFIIFYLLHIFTKSLQVLLYKNPQTDISQKESISNKIIDLFKFISWANIWFQFWVLFDSGFWDPDKDFVDFW